MLHICVERFDVISERKNILGWNGEVNKALVCEPCLHHTADSGLRTHARNDGLTSDDYALGTLSLFFIVK
jgi:hypothetical protein